MGAYNAVQMNETLQPRDDAQEYVDRAARESYGRKMKVKEEESDLTAFREALVQQIEKNPLYQEMNQVMADPVLSDLLHRLWVTRNPYRIVPSEEEIRVPVSV